MNVDVSTILIIAMLTLGVVQVGLFYLNKRLYKISIGELPANSVNRVRGYLTVSNGVIGTVSALLLIILTKLA